MFQSLAKTNLLIVENFKILFGIPKFNLVVTTNKYVSTFWWVFIQLGDISFDLVINKLFGLVIV